MTKTLPREIVDTVTCATLIQ